MARRFPRFSPVAGVEDSSFSLRFVNKAAEESAQQRLRLFHGAYLLRKPLWGGGSVGGGLLSLLHHRCPACGQFVGPEAHVPATGCEGSGCHPLGYEELGGEAHSRPLLELSCVPQEDPWRS